MSSSTVPPDAPTPNLNYTSSLQVSQPNSAEKKRQEADIPTSTHADVAIASQDTEISQTQAFLVNAHSDKPISDSAASFTASENMQAQEPGEEPQILARYRPSDTLHTTKRQGPGDRSSAPPECLRTLHHQEHERRMNYLDRFSSEILPPPTAPLYTQIITYMQRWGIWTQFIEKDERRQEVITTVADRMESVWLEGMRLGLIPRNIPTPDVTDGNDPRDSDNVAGHATKGLKSAQQLAADIMATANQERYPQQQRRKRNISPSREVVLKPRREKGANYGITVGELREAGVTMDMINERVLSGDLDEEDDLMQDILEQVDREMIDGSDWYFVQKKTAYNLMGRDLMVYCLWEVQKCRVEMQNLEDLRSRFTTPSQIRNTQARVDVERDLHDKYLALALILHEKATERSNRGASKDNQPPDEPNTAAGGPAETTDLISIKSKISRKSSTEPEYSSRSENRNSEAEERDGRHGQSAEEQLAPGPYEENSSLTRHASTDMLQANVTDRTADVGMSNVEGGAPSKERRLEDNETVMIPGNKVKELFGRDGKVAGTPPHEMSSLERAATHGAMDGEAMLLSPDSSLPWLRGVESPAPSSSIRTMPKLEPIKDNLVNYSTLVKVNSLLEQAGYESLGMSSTWSIVEQALKAAGIDQAARSKVVDETLHENPSNFTRERTIPQRETADISGLPTRKEIIEHIPAEGLSPEDFNKQFGPRVDPNNTRWHELVLSVAYRDKAKNRWFALQRQRTPEESQNAKFSLSGALGHSIRQSPPSGIPSNTFGRPVRTRKTSVKAVTPATTVSRSSAIHESPQSTPKIHLLVHKPRLEIKLRTKPGFKPGDYSAGTVNNTKGFRWRYLKDATVTERDSMDTVIETYVKDRITFDRTKKDNPKFDSKPDRFGQYEQLSHPYSPKKPVVHGIWDNRNKTPIEGAKWFYDGEDGEWIYPIVAFDRFGYGYYENQQELDKQQGAKVKQCRSRNKSIHGSDGAIEKAQPARSKGGKTDKGKTARGRGTTTPPPPPPAELNSRKRKAETTELERPKRRAAQRAKRYVYDEEDGDDEFVLGSW